MECVFKLSEVRGHASIEISGPFDSPHNEITALVKEIIDQGQKNVIIDLRKTTYFTSNGLASLIVALKHARASEGILFILGPTTDMINIFQLTRLDSIFIIAKDEDELVRLLSDIEAGPVIV